VNHDNDEIELRMSDIASEGRVERLDWDSQFYGISVASVTASSLEDLEDRVKAAERAGFRLVYGFCPAERVRELNSPVFRSALICTHVVFERVSGAIDVQLADGYSLHSYTQAIPEQGLMELAQRAGGYSRFRLDTRLPAGSFERMYAIWIAKSVTGDLADIVYVIRDNKGEIAGFATGSLQSDGICRLGLIAVSDGHQKRGLGRSLVDAIIGCAFEHRVSRIEVTTQETNHPAIRLYESAGFITKSRTAVFHFWLDEAVTIP
jgi:dTDP-4-amino-4,6-dideoxy-D-galactose acyltransferase